MKWNNVLKAHTIENVIAQVVAGLVICTIYGMAVDLLEKRSFNKRLQARVATSDLIAEV